MKNRKTLSISLPESLIHVLDIYARKKMITRSAALVIILRNFFDMED